MVSVITGVSECSDIYCTGISAVILYLSAVHTKESERKKTGSLEYIAGQYHRISGIYISSLFQTSDGFFQNHDLCFLLYQYFSGGTGT